MSKTRVTLKDVANKVGVHSSTVSRVLNPETRKMVTEEIAAKILSAATEMGYRPNAFAQSLKT
ncbi:MAG TPA: LacI family DNA-binding transcriptional regulator, partial [Rhodospirillales bacterium]|nr:LacI family DNA-binding transcriptional regulator [Rhodospirillales bacterium]